MSAEFLVSAKPSWAVIAWTDHNNIFIEIPIKDKAPFLSKYPLTAIGLGEALSQMKRFHTIESGPAVYSAPPRHSPKAPNKTNEIALAILRKHGIL